MRRNTKKINNNTQRRLRPRRRRLYVKPAAQVANAPKRFQTIKTTGTSAIVEGCDLVYKIPDSLTAEYQNTSVISMIPSNPAYWNGTRIAAVASGYQNYRPQRFDVIYIPQCAVTQQGNVLGGTLWNQAPTDENLQQTLKTSNGGMLTQCYQKASSRIKLGTNLQYNLYRMGGPIDQESMPFIFIALGIATVNNSNQRIVPGYFYVRYSYIFKNPIGTGVQYSNSQLTTIEHKESYLLNAVAYMMEPMRTSNGLQIPIGSKVDIEYNNNAENPGYNYVYNGTPVDMLLLRTVWILENQPSTISTSLAEAKRTKDTIYWFSQGETIEDEDALVYPQTGIMYDEPETPGKWNIVVNTQLWDSLMWPIGRHRQYYQIDPLYSKLGESLGIGDSLMQFVKDKAWTILERRETKKALALKSKKEIPDKQRSKIPA